MRPIDKAIWYIESHYEQEITLDALARTAGVSRYHLSHAFSYATGLPVTRYLRYRRLSQAARILAAGESDILGLAMSLGYASHEAFTRAFKQYLGCTPEQVRSQGHTNDLNLLEARKMIESTLPDLGEPRIVDGTALLLAGLSRNYHCDSSAAIPGQWQEFSPFIGHIPGQVDGAAYGVIYNCDEEDNFDYLCGIEVSDFSRVPGNMARLRIPGRTYAVFSHDRHISEIRRTWHTIWSDWLPGSGREVMDAPRFERYTETFDPETGNGGLEVWLPIK